MQTTISRNPIQGLYDVLLHRPDGSVLLGAAPTEEGAAAAAQAVEDAGGHLSAGWVVLARAGGTPYNHMTTRGASWPVAVKRHQAIIAAARAASGRAA